MSNHRTANRLPRSARVAAAALGLLLPVLGAASIISAVSLEDTVAQSERILVVAVLEPLDSLNPCWINYGFRYRVERVLLGPAPAAAEDVFMSSYPRGDVTAEQCPESVSFDAYFGDIRPPFEQGQRLILFFGERVPEHAFESADRLAAVETLLGPRAVPPAPPTAQPTPPVPPAPPVPPLAETGTPTAVAPPPPPPPPTTPVTAPTVLESEGRVVEAGDTELAFVSDEPGAIVVGEGASIAGASAAARQAGQVACRTPCRMRVPNGSYLFRVGSHEFALAATGGVQTWDVEEANDGALAAGEYLTYDGIGALVGGAILTAAELGANSGSPTGVAAVFGYAIMGLGAAALAVGIPLWTLFGGSAELVSETGAPGSTAFALVPGPVAFDPWTGRSAWGLMLALEL
jgi:hypothetical protein